MGAQLFIRGHFALPGRLLGTFSALFGFTLLFSCFFGAFMDFKPSLLTVLPSPDPFSSALFASSSSSPFAPLLAMLLVVVLAGCGHRVPKAVSYSSQEHLAFRASGTATVSGEGFLRRPNGRVVRCSGSEVFLVPDTPYFREWISVFRQGHRFEKSAELVAAHKEAVRVTQCDMAGTFRFGQLPAARWFVATRVTYQLDRVDFRKIDLANDYWSDDAMFIAPVETRSGEVSRPVLSNPNRM